MLNRFGRVAVLRNQQDAVKCIKYTAKCAKTCVIPLVNHFNYFFTYENGAWPLKIQSARAFFFSNSGFREMLQNSMTYSIEHNSQSMSFLSLDLAYMISWTF